MECKKLPRMINLSDIYIAPVRIISDIIPNSNESNKEQYISKIEQRIVFLSKNNNDIIDLETKMMCIEENTNSERIKGMMYVSIMKLIPLNIFVSEKYKHKALNQDKALEISKFIIRKSSDQFMSSILDLIDYNNIYISNVYDNKDNMIIKNALLYRLNNQLIDIKTKEIYLLDEGIIDKKIEANLKLVKPDELIFIDEYTSNKSKKIRNRRRKYE